MDTHILLLVISSVLFELLFRYEIRENAKWQRNSFPSN